MLMGSHKISSPDGITINWTISKQEKWENIEYKFQVIFKDTLEFKSNVFRVWFVKYLQRVWFNGLNALCAVKCNQAIHPSLLVLFIRNKVRHSDTGGKSLLGRVKVRIAWKKKVCFTRESQKQTKKMRQIMHKRWGVQVRKTHKNEEKWNVKQCRTELVLKVLEYFICFTILPCFKFFQKDSASNKNTKAGMHWSLHLCSWHTASLGDTHLSQSLLLQNKTRYNSHAVCSYGYIFFIWMSSLFAAQEEAQCVQFWSETQLCSI